MNSVWFAIVDFIMSFLLTLGVVQTPYAGYTPIDGRAYTDVELDVEPDPSKYVRIVAEDEGHDIYAPTEGASFGYRYGPSMILNADGSIDAYFSAPGVHDEWDWITYRHSPDGGKTWTQEVSVLEPTADSPDFFSCCDPGIIKVGEYYYLGYTSTVVDGGIDNNVFVARSKNPDGPFEKWNGNGWGGKPEPIVEYTGDPTTYGAGEPCFVELDGTLYIYYTWRDGDINQTRVCVADATDENWPETMEYKGVAITYINGAMDSADVKYVEDFGKFIAVCTMDRFTEDSSVGLYVSDDGITFRESNVLKTNISHCCHNCGITSRPNGHIRLEDGVYLAYAYGDEWGYWPTRLHKVQLSLTDAPDFSDMDNTNAKTPLTLLKKSWFINYTGIIPDNRAIEISLSDRPYKINMYKADTVANTTKIYDEVLYSKYDESVIEIEGNKIKPIAVGSTYVTAEWNGFTCEFFVRVTE